MGCRGWLLYEFILVWSFTKPVLRLPSQQSPLREKMWVVTWSSLLLSRSVVSEALQDHGLQHSRIPCPSLSPGACSNLCPLSGWCYPTISFSVTLFSCLQSYPASVSFPVSQFFTSGGQNIGASASTSVLPMNIPGWFPLGLNSFISLLSMDKGKWYCIMSLVQVYTKFWIGHWEYKHR